MKPVISVEINSSLIASISREEVKEVVFQSRATKAPGPDSFSDPFYWDVFYNDIYQVVFHFFQTCQMPHAINFTESILIPKVQCPESLSQF